MSVSIQHLPESFESERLILRVPKPGDGQVLLEAYNESLERLRPWFPWAQETGTLEEREQFVRQQYAKFIQNEDMMLFFFLKDSGILIGCGGLHYRGLNVPKFEIGYWVRTGFEGKGYITEAVNAITRFGFEQAAAQRIFIRCDINNLRSQAVAKRVGYIYEGTFRNFERRHHTGELTDMMYFALTRRDYESLIEKKLNN
jgi:RimJ/RimL family protein N-acetyltransferase